MKAKKFLLTVILFTTASLSKAQELGVRFGDAIGGNVAADAIIGLGKFSRVHADVSFGSGLGVDALWDFMYRPLKKEAFNWYVGVGPSVRFDDPFTLGAAGEVGLSYTFNNVPISLSGDWRPTFIIIEDTDFHGGWFGFNVRYIFGKKGGASSEETPK